jgi:RNA polymerase-binding transcription factor DksA
VDSHLEIAPPPLFTQDELGRLRRKLLAKGRDLAQELSELMAGLKPKATDLLEAKPGETRIERVRRYLDLVDRKIKAVAAGRYGLCDSCATPIPLVQLNELPWLERCAGCRAQPA